MMRSLASHRWMSLAVVVVLAALVLSACSGESEEPAGGATAVGTPFPQLEPAHITEPQRFTAYNSNPPASGTHWPRWARCGVYPEGLENEVIVHNLEHGNVVISYNLKDQADVDQLTRFAERLKDWGQHGVLRSYPDMPDGQVAIAAWGIMDVTLGVDEERIKRFWGAYAPNRRSGETRAGGPIPCNR